MNCLKSLFLLLPLLFFLSCSSQTESSEKEVLYRCPMKCEGEKTVAEAGKCSVCKMDLHPVNQEVKEEKEIVISETSVYNLTTKWETQAAKTIELKELKGKTAVAVMIYTSCEAACPRLAADMRRIETEIPADLRAKLNFVLISIDPENDTPERLRAFADENQMTGAGWTFLRGTPAGVRELANVLAVRYKQISPIDFSHSNIISVFDPAGELVFQQEGLGVDNKNIVATIIKTVNKNQ